MWSFSKVADKSAFLFICQMEQAAVSTPFKHPFFLSPSEGRSPIYCVSVYLDRSERRDGGESGLYRCGLRTDDGRAFVRIGNPISGGVPSAAAAAAGREDSAKGD